MTDSEVPLQVRYKLVSRAFDLTRASETELKEKLGRAFRDIEEWERRYDDLQRTKVRTLEARVADLEAALIADGVCATCGERLSRLAHAGARMARSGRAFCSTACAVELLGVVP